MAKSSVGKRPAVRRARRPATPAVAPAAAAIRYIESSALLAALLEGDAAALAALRAGGRRITSVLTVAEATRAVIRARAMGRMTAPQEQAAIRAIQAFARRCDLVEVTDAVLGRVGRRFPVEPVRTLDAVHLATAEALGEPPQLLTIVTRDHRVRDNARALGYLVD